MALQSSAERVWASFARHGDLKVAATTESAMA